MPRLRVRVSGLLLRAFLFAGLFAGCPAQAQQERWQQLDQQATTLYRQGRYAEAIPVAQQAVEAAEAGFGGDDPRLAVSLSRLASLYRETGDYAQAEPLFERALQIREKALGRDDPEVAATLNDLADLDMQQGRYAQAEPLLQRALRIREKALGAEHPDVAQSLNTLAALYYYQDRYAEAERLYQRALRIWEKSLGPEHTLVATCLDNLAQLYRKQGRYAEAEPLSRRAVAILEKQLGAEHPEVALALNNLASLYQAEGKYGEAEPLYQRALAIDEKALGPEHPQVANLLNNLGELDWEQGRYAEAEPRLQRAFRIWVKALGPEHPQVGDALGNLGALHHYQGRYAEAEQEYQLALEIQERAQGRGSPALIAILGGLAGVYRDQGKLAEAEPLYRRALGIAERALGEDHPETATTLTNLAGLYREQGRYAEAQAAYERALGIYEKALGPEHPYVALAASELGILYYAQQQPEAADRAFQRALAILARRFQYSFTYMSERERLAFLDSVLGMFPLYFSFGQSYAPQRPELTGQMYDLLLWEKGFIAGSEAALRQQVEASGDAEALKLLDQLAAKRAQLGALINGQPQDRAAWRKQIEQLEAEANALERALVARSAAFAQQKKLERVTWQQVRDALKPGEAAVEFARFRFFDGKQWTDRSYYVALVVTPETKEQPQYVVLGEGKALEGAPLVQFRQQVQSRGMEEGGAALPGAEAYDLFWKPLEAALAGKKRVYVAPDGALNQMPLGLMPTPDGRLLMEEYDLRLVSSTKDLLRPATAAGAKTAVLVGDAAFDLDEAQQRASLGRLAGAKGGEPGPVARLAPGDRSRDQGSGVALPALPGSGAEIRSVSELLRQRRWQATTYTGERALEEAVKQARSPRLLHLATHGFFLPDQPAKAGAAGRERPSGLEDPMLRSGLYFAGADRALAGQASPADLDDGVLTAYEASTLDLQGTELVVLSACETGLGQVQAGEGVFGLRRALQIAGAQSVMMTLWSVPDRETQELMTLFYGKWLAGMEKHEALRQAQLEERAVVRKRYGRDLPYYWGAFVLVGK